MIKYTRLETNYCEEEELQYVQAWLTYDSNEEGRIVAKIDLANRSVEYLDPDAKHDEDTQTVIGELVENGYALTE